VLLMLFHAFKILKNYEDCRASFFSVGSGVSAGLGSDDDVTRGRRGLRKTVHQLDELRIMLECEVYSHAPNHP
jgi:hypothetical protein